MKAQPAQLPAGTRFDPEMGRGTSTTLAFSFGSLCWATFQGRWRFNVLRSGNVRLLSLRITFPFYRTFRPAYLSAKVVLTYRDISEPEPLAGHVVIEIKAFGINHAEVHMRRGEWAEAAPVSGIECVGIVKSCPGGEFPIGAKVAALTGGLGRTINGSYAEYTRAPVSNVALIEADLPWT